ncbi:hypothetical protein PSENEW3_00005909 [Picochlorum sp. SENEW3]|nr:hypothetical protein PSENEW3_00005909 [Picochlorum sp. SENEW3]
MKVFEWTSKIFLTMMMRGSAFASLFLPLLAVCIQGNAQPVINVGAGCGDLPPGPPSNLKAVPGDRQVTLSWDKPANGACVSIYTVNAIPLGAGALYSSQSTPQTPDVSYVVSNLQNGQPYRFVVTAVSTKYASSGGNTASIQATPQATPAPPPSPPNRLCLNWVRPSGPGDLRIVDKGATYAKACWDTPTNYGCADYYTVNVQPKMPTMLASAFTPIKIQSGQCYTVQNLSPNTEYVMTVSSYRELYGGGGSSSIDFKTNYRV